MYVNLDNPTTTGVEYIAILDLVNKFFGNLVKKPATRIGLETTIKQACPGMSQIESLAGPGHADIGQAPLLFHL